MAQICIKLLLLVSLHYDSAMYAIPQSTLLKTLPPLSVVVRAVHYSLFPGPSISPRMCKSVLLSSVIPWIAHETNGLLDNNSVNMILSNVKHVMSETCPPDRRSEDSGLTPPAIKARGGTGSGACVLEEKARAIAARRLLVDLGKVLEVTLYPLTGSLVVASFIEAGLLSWNGVPFLVRVRYQFSHW